MSKQGTGHRPQTWAAVGASVQLRVWEWEGEGESDRRLNDRLRVNALTYRHASCIIKRMSGIRNEDRDGTIHGNVVLVAIILHLRLSPASASGRASASAAAAASARAAACRRLAAIVIVMMRPNGIRIHMGTHLQHIHTPQRHACYGCCHDSCSCSCWCCGCCLVGYVAKLIISHQHPIGRCESSQMTTNW